MHSIAFTSTSIGRAKDLNTRLGRNRKNRLQLVDVNLSPTQRKTIPDFVNFKELNAVFAPLKCSNDSMNDGGRTAKTKRDLC
ncbi:hypothetical protein THUN1379_17650 [Paludibacterium sp. THUN1379]|nr:hypothetical protein THUN1379_17650 [Paludibacterium sp. THUN1379]